MAVLVLGLALLPLALAGTPYANYVEHIVVQMLLLGLFAMSWDLIFGYLGLFSFGVTADELSRSKPR